MKGIVTMPAHLSIPVLDIMNAHLEPPRLTGQVTLQADEDELEAQFQVAVTSQKNTTGFWLNGEAQGTVYLLCDTCLEPYARPMTLRIRERFVLNRFTQPGEREQELTGDDFFDVVDLHDTLDLHDLVRQMLVAELAAGQHCPLHEPTDDEDAGEETQ